MQPNSTALRVMLVASRYFPYIGGLETHVYEVGRRLARAGVEVTVLTTDPSGTLPLVEEIEGAQVRRVRAWPAKKDYYFAPAIYEVITRGRWDIVHCQGCHTLAPPLAMLAAWRAGIPYVATFHSGGETSRVRQALRGVQWALLRPLLAHAERLIGVSRFEADFFQQRLRLPVEKFVVIPNGAQHLPSLPDTQRREERGDGPLIVSVGRLERYKGHQRVIAALPKVLEHCPDARLLIVGHGPYEATLRKLACRLRVADHVEIRGIPAGDGDGMARAFSQASVVTLLSEHEGQGIAALEALALRRPVLVATTSALRELVERGLAVGVPLNSAPEEVAAAILEQLQAPRVPAQVTLPSWDSTCDQLLEVYGSATRRTTCGS
jgi:glycosyltransferase involved in cell wall biosynthesis